MAARTQEERIDRLEQVMQIIAEDHLSLRDDTSTAREETRAVKKAIAELATETRRGFDQVAKQSAETDRRMRENDAKVHKRFLETDARIEKLVVAIGKFVSQKH